MLQNDNLPPWVFSSLAVTLFEVVALLAYQKKTMSAFALTIAASLVGVFGQLDHVSEVSAGLQSLTIKLREADNVLTNLRRLVVLTGQTLLTLEDNAGSIGGNPATRKDKLRADVQELFNRTGVSQAEITTLDHQIRTAVIYDYFWSLGDAEYKIFANKDAEMKTFRGDLASTWRGDIPPGPDALEAAINKHLPGDDFARRFEKDYRAYYETGKHSDEAFWSARDYWPASGP